METGSDPTRSPTTPGERGSKLVRLRPFDPRLGQTLQRYTYQGIRFHADRGWCRVEPDVAEHLARVRARVGDPRAPLAFDVCTEEEARALETRERREQSLSRAATDELPLTRARSRPLPVVDSDEADAPIGTDDDSTPRTPGGAPFGKSGKRGKRRG